MSSKYVIVAGLILVISCVMTFVALLISEKEHKKQLKEMLDKTRTDWAKAFDSTEMLRVKEADALKYALSLKDDLIAEKDKRIEQLEADIAMKDMIMACAKLDGSFDEKKLKEMLENISVNCHEVIDV